MTFPNPPRLPDIKGRSFLANKYGLYCGISLQAYFIKIKIPEDEFDPENWQNDPAFVNTYMDALAHFSPLYDVVDLTINHNEDQKVMEVYIFLADKEMAFFSNN